MTTQEKQSDVSSQISLSDAYENISFSSQLEGGSENLQL